MSQKELNQVNKIYHVVMNSLAIMIAIGAILYNTFHLFTACMVFAVGLESDIQKADSDKLDIKY